jgi:hypothetical protein
MVLLMLVVTAFYIAYAADTNRPDAITGMSASDNTNRINRLLQDTIIPEVVFRGASIVDIVQFLNATIEKHGMTEDAKRVRISIDPETEKTLMKETVWEGGGGIAGVYTFSARDISALKTIEVLQKLVGLDCTVDGQKVVLRLKQTDQ